MSKYPIFYEVFDGETVLAEVEHRSIDLYVVTKDGQEYECTTDAEMIEKSGYNQCPDTGCHNMRRVTR